MKSPGNARELRCAIVMHKGVESYRENIYKGLQSFSLVELFIQIKLSQLLKIILSITYPFVNNNLLLWRMNCSLFVKSLYCQNIIQNAMTTLGGSLRRNELILPPYSTVMV